ncbi:MAG: enoyl-CoA hydratase-related protein [Pseudomonadota bacterium]
MLAITEHAGAATITLNRPEIHNAFNAALINELGTAITELDQRDDVRVIVLAGAGRSFSAGADLNWMREMASAGEQENIDDALNLARLLRTLAFTATPTIARVHGAAYGGGVGLVACCDIALGVPEARFGLTEARLGLVPAVISPYVIAAVGARQAGKLFMTAEVFDGRRAAELNLLHTCVESDELDAAVAEQIGLLKKSGPQAIRAAKSLVGAVAGRTPDAQHALDEATAKLIASLRGSPEGREGVSAFLEKRPASWIDDE